MVPIPPFARQDGRKTIQGELKHRQYLFSAGGENQNNSDYKPIVFHSQESSNQFRPQTIFQGLKRKICSLKKFVEDELKASNSKGKHPALFFSKYRKMI